MKYIPQELKDKISALPFMKRCCITGSKNVSWEHCWCYGRGQINEVWAIVPLRRDLNTSHPPKDVKEKCQLISLMRATPEDLAKYPKRDWNQIYKYLSEKYADFKNQIINSQSSLEWL